MPTARLIFSSIAIDPRPTTVAAILRVSRRNNPRDGVTGVLVSGEHRFLQFLEGDPAGVERCFWRIRHDARHRDVSILSFGMACELLFPNAAMRAVEARDLVPSMKAAMSPQASPAQVMEAFVALSRQPPAPSPLEPEIAGALAVLERIYQAAQRILDDHLNQRHVAPETLARLRESLGRQARHARDLRQRLAMRAPEVSEHHIEAMRLCDLLEAAEREVARRLDRRH